MPKVCCASRDKGNKLEGFQNNSKQLVVIIYDSSNNLYDLSGYNAYFYAKKFPIRAGSTLDVSIAASSLDASLGAAYFVLTASALTLTPGDYLYEVIIDDGGANRITVIQDKLNLLDSIT